MTRITERAGMDKKTIVLPESTDIRTIKATAMILEQGFANIILVGEEDKINELKGDLDLSGARIVNPATSDKREDYANTLYELRKNKGMTLEQAREKRHDGEKGEVDLVWLQEQSLSRYIEPALQILKTARGKLASLSSLCVPDCEFGHNGTFLYADSGLVEIRRGRIIRNCSSFC